MFIKFNNTNNKEIKNKSAMYLPRLPLPLLKVVGVGLTLLIFEQFDLSIKSVRVFFNKILPNMEDKRLWNYLAVKQSEGVEGAGLINWINRKLGQSGYLCNNVLSSNGNSKFVERLWEEFYQIKGLKNFHNIQEISWDGKEKNYLKFKLLKEDIRMLYLRDSKFNINRIVFNENKFYYYKGEDNNCTKFNKLTEAQPFFKQKHSNILETLIKNNIISYTGKYKSIVIPNDNIYINFWREVTNFKSYAKKHKKITLLDQMQNTTTDSEKTIYAYRIILDKTRIIDKGDGLPNIFNFGAWLDFTDPTSLEFKGIYELYHFVMFKLLFIFCLLLILSVLSIYYCVKISIYSIISTKTKEFDDFSQNIFEISKIAFLLTIKKNKNESKFWEEIFKFLKIYNIFDLEKNTHVIINTNKTTNINRQTSTFDKFNKIDSIFTPSAFWVHFSKLEFIWTIIPCFVLLLISLPSFTLALSLDETHKPASWIKITGNQWYWIYEYSTYDENITLYSNIIYGSDLINNSLRLLEPDICITLINNKHTRLLITSSDVIHSWTIPALGLKVDACPGRINSVSILPTRPGVYYGQCSEICGVNHGFMPIVMEIVP